MIPITRLLIATVVTTAIAAPASAKTWDRPLAYPAPIVHSALAVASDTCVTTCTGGDITIATHPLGASSAGNDIKRATQTGQVPIGARLMSVHQKENPVFGLDSIPFLVRSCDGSAPPWEAGKATLEKVLADQDLTQLYTVPCPPQGICLKTPINASAGMSGIKFRAFDAATAGLAEYVGNWPARDDAGFTLQGLRDDVMMVEPASDRLKSDLQALGEAMTAEGLQAAGEDGRTIVAAYRAMR